MNSLVYKAVQRYVVDKQGTDSWDLISGTAFSTSPAETPFERVSFAGHQHIISVASATLKQPVADLLESAGRHWITSNREQVNHRLTMFHRASFGFGPRSDMEKFYKGISTIFPSLRPPTLHCVIHSPKRATLLYVCRRGQCAPFVFGVLTGLGACFAPHINVRLAPDLACSVNQDRRVLEFQIESTAELVTAGPSADEGELIGPSAP